MIPCATTVTQCSNAGMLAQFGSRSFSPVIEWESVMRIIHEASTYVTKSDATPSAMSVWSMDEVATPQPRPSAMSRLMTCVIEGLAAYAEATHPYLVDRVDDTPWRTTEQHPQAPWNPQDYRSGEWAHSSQPSPRPMRWSSDRIGSRVARLFGKLRFGRKYKAPIVRVDTLDDRVLRDIGVDRHQFEFQAGQMGPDGW